MRRIPLPDREQARRILDEIAVAAPAPGPRRADKPLLLYGGGNLGRMAKVLLDQIGIEVTGVVDANAEQVRSDRFWSGTRVLSPNELSWKEREECLLAVTIATLPWSSMWAELRNAGWRDIIPFYDLAEAYRDLHPLGNGWFSGALTAIDVDETARVLDRWEDDLSRAHHLQFIAWHTLRRDWIFADAPVNVDDRFFIPEVCRVLRADESFADFGAHTGSVCLRFIEETGGRFESIWAVEPDHYNRAALHEALDKLPTALRARIHVLPHALSDAAQTATFFPGLGYASQCSPLGTVALRTEPVDGLGIAPSFIKLHLEGAELAALRGARATLLRHRPIVAATSYHDRSGIWELPRWLMLTLGDYAFHLRMHSWCGTGAVIYCIPRERTKDAPR